MASLPGGGERVGCVELLGGYCDSRSVTQPVITIRHDSPGSITSKWSTPGRTTSRPRHPPAARIGERDLSSAARSRTIARHEQHRHLAAAAPSATPAYRSGNPDGSATRNEPVASDDGQRRWPARGQDTGEGDDVGDGARSAGGPERRVTTCRVADRHVRWSNSPSIVVSIDPARTSSKVINQPPPKSRRPPAGLRPPPSRARQGRRTAHPWGGGRSVLQNPPWITTAVAIADTDFVGAKARRADWMIPVTLDRPTKPAADGGCRRRPRRTGHNPSTTGRARLSALVEVARMPSIAKPSPSAMHLGASLGDHTTTMTTVVIRPTALREAGVDEAVHRLVASRRRPAGLRRARPSAPTRGTPRGRARRPVRDRVPRRPRRRPSGETPASTRRAEAPSRRRRPGRARRAPRSRDPRPSSRPTSRL